MGEPKIIVGDTAGHHNQNGTRREYRDLSTVCVIPTRGVVPIRAVETWMGLQAPMNQPFTRICVEGYEVGEAYNSAINLILNHPQLSQWKYVLTLEEDNLPPPDGLIRLLDSIEGFAAVGGLYWTKGEDGQPMCYGKPGGDPAHEFSPWLPDEPTLVPCNGLGMGFTLFRLELFRELDPPWFVTQQERTPEGFRAATQDLYFFKNARAAGKRVACDTRVQVGHLDVSEDKVW